MSRSGWTSGAVDLDGRSVHYYRTGGSLPLLLLLHGLTDDGLCWSRVARSLDDQFDVVMPDARGHGRSSRLGTDDFSVPDLVSDVERLMDALGMTDAAVFGHSMGAITAAYLAGQRPDLVGGLVLEDPPLDILAVDADVRRATMLREIEPLRRSAEVDRYRLAAGDHREWSRLETDAWAEAKVIVDLDVLDHLDAFDGLAWRRAFGRMSAPGLLLTGDPESGAIITPAVGLEAERIWPPGSLVHVPGAGHCIHRDRWAAAMEPVRRFLTKWSFHFDQPPR